MDNIQARLVICGVDKVSNYRLHNITHMVSIANPDARIVRPSWFAGEHLELWFGDVISDADAAKYKTLAPSVDDVVKVLNFMSRAWSVNGSKVLFHCDYGASRSPAIAYVALAHELSEGSDEKALQTILEIQPNAVPNKMVVQLGDVVLKRNGALLKPLYELYRQISEDLEGCYECR
jgi:predicted protein tyrosine phosphatase